VVVLFDEIERAHHEVFGTLVQVLSIGREVETRIGRSSTDAISDGATIPVHLKGDELVMTHGDPQPATGTAA
jgi:hypothetical protein